jgi:hypothetical protein
MLFIIIYLQAAAGLPLHSPSRKQSHGEDRVEVGRVSGAECAPKKNPNAWRVITKENPAGHHFELAPQGGESSEKDYRPFIVTIILILIHRERAESLYPFCYFWVRMSLRCKDDDAGDESARVCSGI